ncbi:hypothetical protein FRC02_010155 [Tulasnella sp. 418]|nr:hypothetical protein FRC02_010155 [Tulasnella sp. 418]
MQEREKMVESNKIPLFVINHVFMPLQLPQEDDLDEDNEQSLCVTVYEAAQEFGNSLDKDQVRLWNCILTLLENFVATHRYFSLAKDDVADSFKNAKVGDNLAFYIRAQNAGVIIRKETEWVIFELFEVSAPNKDVMASRGRLIRSFPDSAIRIPRAVFNDPVFQVELAGFLAAMDVDSLDTTPVTAKAKTAAPDVPDAPHPRYITQLLTEILRGLGKPAKVPEVTKRIADDILASNANKPWRRSAVWLVLRVAMQTTLARYKSGPIIYKAFIAFLHAGVLNMGLDLDLPSYLIVCMQRKCARRLSKLEQRAPSFLPQFVKNVVDQADDLLQKRWNEARFAQENSLGSTWAPQTLDVEGDTELSLHNSREYILRSLNNALPCKSSKSFSPNSSRRFLGTKNFIRSRNSLLAVAFNSEDHLIALADFERAVLNDLDGWANGNLYSIDACLSIATCMAEYKHAASKSYSSNPELLSTMILTLFRLWVEIDRMATAQYPLLAQFSPEIPHDLLHPLLLRTSESIEALEYVEQHLKTRHVEATTIESIFSVAGSTSFAEQYFDQSERLQALKIRIEETARSQREEKIKEIERLKTRYQKLMRWAEQYPHRYFSKTDENGQEIRVDAPECARCKLEKQALGMKIKVYEWPLPQDPSEAKVVVFELAPPFPFVIWRNITYMLLRDVCIPNSSSFPNNSPHAKLHAYGPFTEYFDQSAKHPRLALAATFKSSKSRKKLQNIASATEKSVCVQHGLNHYSLFDKTRDEWVSEEVAECSISDHCIIQLPPGRYRGLQYAISGTSHTSNDIMVNQTECPPNLTLHEFIAFCRIRSGPRIQWLSIISELRVGTLNFQDEAVLSLIRQAIWQIGPSARDGSREWHIDLAERHFGETLLAELRSLLLKLKSNRRNVVAMQVIAALISRILSSAVDNAVINDSVGLMKDVRRVTYGWLNAIISALGEDEDENRVHEWQMNICQVAATCRETYNVDLDTAPVILASTEDVAIFIHCAILFKCNSPSNVSDADPQFRDLLYRDCRLAQMLEPLLSHLIAQSREGLDQSILRIWSLYRPSTPWKHMAAPDTRWITTKTARQGIQKPQVVHLDLLSGLLLIDGRPLGQLPKRITRHPMYTRIFGHRRMEVIPSDMPGMDFKLSSTIGSDSDNQVSGYQVFFAFRPPELDNDTGQLVIRIQRDDEILELIPNDIFKDDLPAVFLKDKTHWLNISNLKGKIEMRDVKRWWESSANNWWIDLFCNGSSFMNRKFDDNSDELRLIDPRSATMSMIAAHLRPLENSEYLIVTHSSYSGRLAVTLPRFRLEFFVNDELEPQLESLNMPGMIVDSNQSSETMIGLRSQLVLRPRLSPESYPRHVVIPYIPDPPPLISPSSHSTCITLSLNDQPVIRYFVYGINSTLGRLDGDGTMLSKLYQIYLHAITSHCLPDPLTRRTGTEEALQELQCARMMSFQKLGEDERRMLKHISELTPIRAFYPSHLEEKQKVTWSKHTTCPLAQHSRFYVLTHSIWKHAETLTQITRSQAESQPMDSCQSSPYLLQRAAYHNAIFDRDQTSGSAPSHEGYDTVYRSRGRSIYSRKADKGIVFETCSMILQWEARLSSQDQVLDTLMQYGFISGPSKISLSYSREWIERNIADLFLPASNACRTASKTANRYQLVFSLSACAYASVDSRPFIPIIFAFATNGDLRNHPPPSWPTFNPSVGLEPSEESITEIILRCKIQPSMSRKEREVRGNLYTTEKREEREVRELVHLLMKQWPSQAPVIRTWRKWEYEIRQVEEEVTILFKSCLGNKEIIEYFQNIQRILDLYPQPAAMQHSVPYEPPLVNIQPRMAFRYCSFQQLVAERDAPDIYSPPTPSPSSLVVEGKRHQTGRLRELLSEFRENTFLSPQSPLPTPIQAQYAKDLEESLKSLESEVDTTSDLFSGSRTLMVASWRRYQRQCEAHLHTAYQMIRESLLPSTKADEVLFTAGLWPCLTTQSLLSSLSSNSGVVLTSQWRKTLNFFVQALLTFQQSCRLIRHLHERNLEEFYNEVESRVMEGDDDDDELCSIRHLIQVDCNFLARQIQIDFINEMTAPSSRANTVLQLNMGEGKSSVIVPVAAAMLADGNKLVRVVVLRPLAPSMFQILVHRLGGLANRRVFYLPFSRTPRLTLEQVQQVRQIFTLCTQLGGVLVVQPDHILSFKLMGLDRSINTSTSIESTDSMVAHNLLESQQWIFGNSRDILDESDEILHVKYQLVYTVGQQQSLHGSPDRWRIAQEILTLVGKHARHLNHSFPDSFEVIEDHSGCYPRIRILRDDAGKALIHLLAGDISKGALSHLSFDLFPPELRSVALSYITSLNVTSNWHHMRRLEEYCKHSDSWNTFLILRGLLAHGILQFVLKEKRWRVDYGPDISRSLLAVPYRAKDVPSLRAEFSHPDVAILLTYLSYYWQGLSQNQLQQSFHLMLKQGNPSLEYSKWIVHGHGIPERLRHVGSVNLRDRDQCLELHRIFHKNQAIINFFLSQVVFPHEAKEFPRKMATSGWDLAERKAHVTTGFSGTNDGRYLLPTSINQADPLSQSSTNAKVLMYLLRSENDVYHCVYQDSQRDLEQSLLRLLVKQKPEIRVLLDVGAQILKLSNEEVVTQWLELNANPNIHAAVFFGPNDESYVRTRTGVIEEFVSSPFRQQLDKCILYLDDAHTRGTDFKLPSGIRAAVTLGPKVTKDRLVQGCMRMRKLGRGQTVMFVAPPEVDHSIRVAAGVEQNDPITTKDIVLWTMFESCLEVLQRIPQWAQQGMDHRKRESAWMKFNNSARASADSLIETWLQNEARSLDEMYAVDQGGSVVPFSDQLEGCPDISTRYKAWAASTFTNPHFQEEQEREIVFEVENERGVERPATVAAAAHSIHSDVIKLVRGGIFSPNSPAFVNLFSKLSTTNFEERSWSSPQLYCTKDFSVTTEKSKYNKSGDYLRPVNWVLSCVQEDADRIFVVLSPYEVNALLPAIRRSKKVHLHQYSPRTTEDMKSFEDLAFHCVPPLTTSWIKPDLDVITRLNLWAGQLYLEDERAYHHLCNYLGLYSWQPKEGDGIQADGFVERSRRRGTTVVNSTFQKSPVPYLKELFAARRKGMDYASTHMGKILRGRLLTDEDFHENESETA